MIHISARRWEAKRLFPELSSTHERNTDRRALGPATTLVLCAPVSGSVTKHIPAATTRTTSIDAFRMLVLIDVRRDGGVKFPKAATGFVRRFRFGQKSGWPGMFKPGARRNLGESTPSLCWRSTG